MKVLTLPKATYSVKELLELRLDCLPSTGRSIDRKSQRENWPFTWEKCQGPARKAYLANLLPDYVKAAIVARKKIDDLALVAHKKSTDQPLTAAQKKKALARADLVRLYVTYILQAPWGKKDQAKAEFIAIYKEKEWPNLFAILGEVSLQSLERWKKTIEDTSDPYALADKRGSHKKGKRSLTVEQGAILIRLALNPNNPKVSYVIRLAQAIMQKRGIDHHSKATYRRYLLEYKARNYDKWVFAREGEKALNDKVAYNIKRDYSKINVGDVLVADGHVLNFDIVNPWTGKPKRMALILWYDMKSNMPMGWEIMPTENTAAISSALRRAIVALGKIPKCVYLDNGKAFKSRFFTNSPDFSEDGFAGLYARLGIETTFAWAYHGQSKTVERFFGIFHEAEVWIPTYVGSSIANKPPRMHRGEKLHVALWEKAMQGLAVTLDQAHAMIASFFDDYSQREQGPESHMAGQRPIDVFTDGRGPGVDGAELRELMMDVTVKRIGQDGIRLWKEDYYHPALYGRRHPVVVRYDLQDRSSILVYEEDGAFIGKAEPRQGVHPMAKLGSEEDQQILKEQIEQKRSLAATTIGPARELLKNEIMPDYMRQLEGHGLVPVKEQPRNGRKPTPKKLSQAEIKRMETEYQQRLLEQEKLTFEADEQQDDFVPTVEDQASTIWSDIERLDGAQRYEKLVEQDVQSRLIPKKWQAWMQYFEMSPEYESQLDYWEEYRAKMCMMYQVEEAEK